MDFTTPVVAWVAAVAVVVCFPLVCAPGAGAATIATTGRRAANVPARRVAAVV